MSEPIAEDDVAVSSMETSEPKSHGGRRRRKRQHPGDVFRVDDLASVPWLGWLFIYTFSIFYFSASRCVALKALVTKYSSSADYTASIKAAVLGLGFLEDFVCTTYFASALWLFDVLKQAAMDHHKFGAIARVFGSVATFAVSWLLFLAMMGPFIADLLLVVHRDMRFSSGLVATLIREREHLKDAPISEEEVSSGYINAVGLVLVATFFGIVRTFGSWTDLARWNPTQMVSNFLVPRLVVLEKRGVNFMNNNAVQARESTLEEGSASPETAEVEDANSSEESAALLSPAKRGYSYQQLSCHHAVRLAVALVGLVGFPAIVVEISCASSPLVAYSALNATLNELFAYALQPAPSDVTLTTVIGERPWVETYIHTTEKHELFGVDSLYRRTTGFRGDLAFDVEVSSANPPNVLVLGVESFRFQDSRYLVGEVDPSNLFKGTDMTLTPNFDRWAKRGVAMRNIWSSNPTSRSLESVLFAQIPYDSAVKTAITGGRNGTELSGMPQLFTQKGYETWFTTGSSIDLDDWDKFLPTHGFGTIWDNKKMMEIAESDLGITPDDWLGDAHRGLNWGVHDDLSFQILGDLLVNTTKEQRERVASGEPKKPAFITHYTITSHAPFDSWPTWYAESEQPDFSIFLEGHPHADLIERYLTVRSFTDLELGKFMDRMLKEGVLDDTIVVITGDHGQAPEADVTNTHEESMTRVAAAIIAEGRLGDAVGMVIEDAVEQYDFLNTLADITGVPEGGFIQTGVGRSLKRKVPYGERVVFSNEPARKMSIVRGHQRLRYDQVSDSMTLHDTESDHAMNVDLFPNLTTEAQAEWQTWRDHGRRLAAYYTKRWDENCLLAVNCTASP
ncbi:Sulfatase protein [Phytophthora cinnamomi]|uniref:Sulfatase protein n=1 Tax=Phytophthora cinnamomi TaxID=4785 RepID=UPI003559A776|nr:Sulfatase protein [Phytophthora cinnamomi]